MIKLKSYTYSSLYEAFESFDLRFTFVTLENEDFLSTWKFCNSSIKSISGNNKVAEAASFSAL